MQQADFQRFKSVMTGMAKVYERELEAILLDAYWLALKAWSLTEFEQAAGHLMTTSKFMPRPADFAELRKAGRPTAGEAWARVLDYVRNGCYRWEGGGFTQKGEPAIDALSARVVAALGGYRVIGMTDEDKVSYVERRFAEHYEAMRDAEDVREAIPQIAGPDRQRLKGPQSVQQLLAHQPEEPAWQ